MYVQVWIAIFTKIHQIDCTMHSYSPFHTIYLAKTLNKTKVWRNCWNTTELHAGKLLATTICIKKFSRLWNFLYASIITSYKHVMKSSLKKIWFLLVSQHDVQKWTSLFGNLHEANCESFRINLDSSRGFVKMYCKHPYYPLIINRYTNISQLMFWIEVIGNFIIITIKEVFQSIELFS